MNILDLKRKLLPMSGPQSGGGGSSSAPSDTTQTVTKELPEWAKGYAKSTLERASALTDQPTQAYGFSRIAGFSPMQLASQQTAAGMTPSSRISQGAGISEDIAQRGLNTQTFGAAQADQYMNPYMQNVVDIQKREAARQSGIQGTQQQAGATAAGAFGGSRDAIQRAERERNLGQQMNDIQAQGSNAAFQQAQAQFNADQARSMQGLNTAGAAAGQLGTFGGQEFQQGMDINKLQNAYGGQQQALRQEGLTQAYQDYLGQKQAPYTQLGFMSNMIQGLPLGGSTQTSAPGPSGAQTLGALGTAAYGLSKFMADGGSVDSQENIENIVNKLSDRQLVQAQEAARARGDDEQLRIISLEQAARASMKRGIGAAPVDMDKMMPTQESMARGGIVAFQVGGLNEGEGPNYDSEEVADTVTGPGDEAAYAEAVKEATQAEEGIRNAKYKSYTPEMRSEQIKRTRAELMEGVGASPYEAQRKEIEQIKADSAKNLEQGKGLAALQAASAMLQGGNAIRGLAAGAGEFGKVYGEAVRADQANKRALQNMQINLADAERKERMGLNKEAMASANQAQKDQHAAQVFEIDRNKALGILARQKAMASRAGSKAAAMPKYTEQLMAARTNELMKTLPKKLGETEAERLDRATSKAGFEVAAALKSSYSMADVGGNKAALGVSSAETARQTAADAQVDKWFRQNKHTPAYMDAPLAEKQRLLNEQKQLAEEKYKVGQPILPSDKPAAAPAKAAKSVPVSQIPAGTTYGKLVQGKGTEVIKDGKVIGYAN